MSTEELVAQDSGVKATGYVVGAIASTPIVLDFVTMASSSCLANFSNCMMVVEAVVSGAAADGGMPPPSVSPLKPLNLQEIEKIILKKIIRYSSKETIKKVNEKMSCP